MADTNTYNSFQKVEKWTTKEKFNAFDLSTIETGTEYNLTGNIGADDLDANLQAKIKKIDEIDQKSSVSPIESSPPEGSGVIRGVNIDGSDYAFPNRYEHWISCGFTNSDSEFYFNFSFKSDDHLAIGELSEVPSGYYIAYVGDNSDNFSGLARFHSDGSGNYLISGAIYQNGSMDAYTFAVSDINFYSDTVTEP